MKPIRMRFHVQLRNNALNAPTYRVAKKQPSECGVDTVGGTVGVPYRLQVVVYDSKGLNATAERIITLTLCDEGEVWCEDSNAAGNGNSNGVGNNKVGGLTSGYLLGRRGKGMGHGLACRSGLELFICSEVTM
jgi:hypothetical protein